MGAAAADVHAAFDAVVDEPMMNRITEQATAESRMMRRTSFQVSVL